MSGNRLTFIDLFAGAGGLSEGFINEGFVPVAHVEMDTHAAATLRTRACFHRLSSGKTNGELYNAYLKGNVSREELYAAVPCSVTETIINAKMTENSLTGIFGHIDNLIYKNDIEGVDLLLGGPPCQAYSLVGRARCENKMINDSRNYLYTLYIKFLQRYQPKMFVFENVPGMLNANRGVFFRQIKDQLSSAGYDFEYHILNAAEFGVLQNRKRVIIVGWRKELRLSYPSIEKIKQNYRVKSLLEDLPSLQAGESGVYYAREETAGYLSKFSLRAKNDVLTWHVARPHNERDREIYRLAISAWHEERRRLKYTELPEELCTHNNKKSFLDRFRVVADNLLASQTITAHISKDGHYYIHPDIEQARSLTVREAARIQSFPDNYFFEGPRTSAFVQIGNAVPPLLAKGIASAVKNIL